MTKETLKKLMEILPKHPGILNHKKYLNSAVLIPLVSIEDTYYLLFEVRKETIRQGGEICFPGGKIQVDETSEAAAKRETSEELGIDENKIHIIGRMDTLVATFGVTVEIFVGVLDIKDLKELQVNPQEVESVFVLPVSWFVENTPEMYHIRVEVQPSFIKEDGTEQALLPAKALGLPNRYHQPWGHQQLPVYVYMTEKGVLWGITAEIVREFIKIIF